MSRPHELRRRDLPRDFSVYYIAAWRMLHNPSQIFTAGALPDGEPAIYPSLTPYKYLPSFLSSHFAPCQPKLLSGVLGLSTPSNLLSCHSWLSCFTSCWKTKTLRLPLLVLVAVLLLPYPMAGRGLSVSYFMSWAEGQAKILLSFLLACSRFTLAIRGKPALSGVAFALGAFDPRFALVGVAAVSFLQQKQAKTRIGCIHSHFCSV